MKTVELPPQEEAVTLLAGGRKYLVQIEEGRLHVSVMDNDHIMLVHPSSSKVVVQSIARSRFEEMERATRRTPEIRPSSGTGSAQITVTDGK